MSRGRSTPTPGRRRRGGGQLRSLAGSCPGSPPGAGREAALGTWARRRPARRAVRRARCLARLRPRDREARSPVAGHAVDGWLIDLDGGWWRLPERRPGSGDSPRSPIDDPARARRRRPVHAARRARQAVLGPDRPRSSSRRSTARSARTARPGAARIGRAGLLRLGSRRLGDRHGQVAVQARLRGPRRAGRALDRGARRRVRRRTSEPRSRGSRPSPRSLPEPSSWSSRPGSARASACRSCTARPSPRSWSTPSRRPSATTTSLLVEAYVSGARELEVARPRQRRDDVEVFGPGEIIPGREFYDYEAKYRSSASRSLMHPDLGCRGSASGSAASPARCTSRSGPAGSPGSTSCSRATATLVVSEINTIPGFTPISLFPLLCADGGHDFADTCERIVQLALERATHRPARRLTRADLP